MIVKSCRIPNKNWSNSILKSFQRYNFLNTIWSLSRYLHMFYRKVCFVIWFPYLRMGDLYWAECRNNIVFFLGIHSIGHEVKVPEGTSIHLPCLYTASGNVEIDWFKDKGQNVRHSEGRALGRMSIQKTQLEINNVRPQDIGNYSCHVKAWQRDQSATITYTLIVLSKSICVS